MRTETSFTFEPDRERLKQLPDGLVLLSGSSNKDLANRIGRYLDMHVGFPVNPSFADEELNVQIKENLRNRNVVIIQSTSRPADTHIMELALIADAALLASGEKITAAIPYYGYGRQDRKTKPREPVSAAVVSNIFVGAGVDHIVTVDLHSKQTTTSVRKPWDDIPAKKVLLPEIERLNVDNLMIVSPDEGGQDRAGKYADALGVDFAIVSKRHPGGTQNITIQHGVNGEVVGMDCVLVDDMIDTGGSLVQAAQLLLDHGARSVSAAATHGVLSSNAVGRIHDSPIQQVIITDTVRPSRSVAEAMHRSGKFRRVTVAPLIAHAIYCNATGESISDALY